VVRVALGRHRGGVRIALDDTTQRCAPCSATAVDAVSVVDITGRVIVRHRTRTGVDDEGVAEYDWVSVYDGPGVWSAVRSVEDDDASGASTETATVTVPALETPLETTASVWDDVPRRWVVTGSTTGQAGGVVIKVSRRVDADVQD
jgi:hypothetical protein